MVEPFYLALLDQLSEGVIAVDPNRKITLANFAARRLFGAALDGNSLESWHQCCEFRCASGNHCSFDDFPLVRALRGQPVNEVLWVRAPEMETSIAVNSTPVRSADGALIGAIARFRVHETGTCGIAPSADIEARSKVHLNDREECSEEEKRFRCLIENWPDAIAIVDRNRVLVFASSSVRQILGYEADGLIGKPILDIVRPEDRNRTRMFLEEIVAKPTVVTTIKCRVLGNDGALRLLECVGKNLLDKPSVDGIVLVFRDVERCKNSAAGPQGGERFRQFFEAAPIGIVVRGLGSDFQCVNAAFCEMTGYSEQELLRLKAVDIIHPEDREHEFDGITRLLLGEVSRLRIEERQLTKEGKSVWVRADMVVLRNELGNPSHVLTIVENISERKQVEAALLESKRRYEEVFENASDFIYTTDESGRFTSVNPAVERLTEYSRDKLLGMKFTQLLLPQCSETTVSIIRRWLRDRAPDRAEFDIRTRTGRCVTVEISTAVLVSNGKPTGVLGVGRDITERKQVEEKLRASHARLRELTAYVESAREQERTRVAREIHDELGQMLTVLKMDLEGVAAKCSMECAAQNGVLERIVKMSEHIQATIQSVKRISAELRPGVLDQLGLVAALEWQSREFQSHTGISCSLRCSSDDIELDAVRSTGVFRIFQETLTNVARHSKASSVEVRLKADRHRLTLKITDDGIGLREEHVTDAKSLGLQGMRERAMLMGGTIEFNGMRGKGTSVTLRIPMRCPVLDDKSYRSHGVAMTSSNIRAAVRPLSILLADDHTIFRQGLREVLAERFPTAIFGEAANGWQAIQQLREGTWDILLLDLSMPGKSGLAVLDNIQNLGIKVPVLVLSTYAQGDYERRVLQAGAAGFINKGQVTSELADAITRIVNGEGAFDSPTDYAEQRATR
jgi:PAS domain S-box-containing protein